MRKSDTSKRLEALLRFLGTTQKELSKISGVPDSAICRAIKGESNLSIKNLIRIAESTKVSPNWLLGFGEDDVIPNIENFKITSDFEKVIKKLPGVEKTFVYGTKDWQYKSLVPFLKGLQAEKLTLIEIDDADHEFHGRTDEFISLTDML